VSSTPPDAVIGPAYVRTMAAYNAGMNSRLFAAAERLDDIERRRDRGAFWGSVHRTLCHLVWADRIWMSRFADWEKPPVGVSGSADLIEDFAELRAARIAADARLSAWAAEIDQAWLDQDLTWLSGSAGREFTMPRTFLLMHFFNHQTHHRGQAHALITAAGEQTGDTDMFLVVGPPS
jgi:uncharacterized damage-inducible protein DinB